jgi:hypothetical protein
VILSSICSIFPGFTARVRLDSAVSGGVLTIQLRDIAQDGSTNFAGLTRVALEGASEKYFVRPGDVVFRSRGDWSVASAIGSDLPEPALVVMPIFILRPKAGVVDPDYLAWAINSPAAQRYFDREAQGGNMRMIAKLSLESLEISVPDIATQKHIVEIDGLARLEHQLTLDLAEKHRKLTALRLADLVQAPSHSRKISGNRP